MRLRHRAGKPFERACVPQVRQAKKQIPFDVNTLVRLVTFATAAVAYYFGKIFWSSRSFSGSSILWLD